MRRSLIAVLTLAFVLGGCATAPLATCEERAAGNEQQIRSCRLTATFHQLEAVNGDYDAVLIAAGRARRGGLIDDAQLEQILAAGRKAHAALDVSWRLLEAAVATNSDPRGLTLQAVVLVADLARMAVNLGVK